MEFRYTCFGGEKIFVFELRTGLYYYYWGWGCCGLPGATACRLITCVLWGAPEKSEELVRLNGLLLAEDCPSPGCWTGPGLGLGVARCCLLRYGMIGLSCWACCMMG